MKDNWITWPFVWYQSDDQVASVYCSKTLERNTKITFALRCSCHKYSFVFLYYDRIPYFIIIEVHLWSIKCIALHVDRHSCIIVCEGTHFFFILLLKNSDNGIFLLEIDFYHFFDDRRPHAFTFINNTESW